jgi:molecular chaperone GrpE
MEAKPEATPAASGEEVKVAGKKEKKKKEPRPAEIKKDPRDIKIGELTNLVKRVQADFENFKKQQEKEKAAFCKYAACEVVKKLLPLIDSFQLALKSNNNPEEFKKGVELIYSQFWQILEAEGLKPIEALNKELDPFKHEVLLQEDSDKPENTVLEELQKGYMLKDAVLRPAKVKIAKKKEIKKEEVKK